MPDYIIYILILKIREKLATLPYISKEMTSRSKKLLRNILFLLESDNRGIITSFYNKR